MPRTWRVRGNFHTVGEVIVNVEAGGWVAGLAKGARAIKASPQLKGRRIKGGAFTLEEIASSSVAPAPAATQGQLPGGAEPEAEPIPEGGTPHGT